MGAVAVMMSSAALHAQDKASAYRDRSLPAAARAHDLVSQMTLEEKAGQLEDWAPAIPRLGIADYQTWSEALHGVARAGYATVFPQAIGMAATWDRAVVEGMGEVIASEGRAKYEEAQRVGNHRIFYGLTYWSPNINLFRDPRWGRGQETYGEDPYLTGRMGVAFIHGVQGKDPEHPLAVATSKHFAVHSGPESMRHTFDVKVSSRDLEETYLPAFRASVVEGQVKSVMCAYNSIDGTSACANKMLLGEHLRDAWGFKGFVVSDCGAIVDVAEGHHDAPDILHAAVRSIEAGTDLSCSVWSPGFNTLAKAVREGAVREDLLTRSAERLFTARYQLGLLDGPRAGTGEMKGTSDGTPDEHRARALVAAEKSLVLLKNDGVLPLVKKTRKIAVVGPTADLLVSLEGNYNGTPRDPVTPLDGIIKQFAVATVEYAQGSTLAEGMDVPVPRTVFEGGLQTEYFASADWTGEPAARGMDHEIQHEWTDVSPVAEVRGSDYSVRWSGRMRVPAAGKYVLTLQGGESFPYSPDERYRFMLDGKVLSEGELNSGRSGKRVAGASTSMPPHIPRGKAARIEVEFADTKPHQVRVEYSHAGDRAGGGCTLLWKAPADALLAEAVAAAKSADVVIAMVGLSPQLEGEEMPIKIAGFSGGDRTSIDLPASQERLLEAVAATGKPVVVISLSGSAMALRWAKEHAAGVLQAWYPGVEGGTAIARTLAGLNNPAGRLPVTFYTSTNDLPSFTDYSLKNRTYRYYTGKPLWGFGYGLSYSEFHYGPAHLVQATLRAGQPLQASVRVTNTSKQAGDEVVEAYLKTPQVGGPLESLAGFERIHLGPGESREVQFELNARALSGVDEQGQRMIIPGRYQLSLGGAQPEETINKSQTTFAVEGSLPLPK